MPRSRQRGRARQSSSTESAGYLRCDGAGRDRPFPRRLQQAPGAAHLHARWRGWPRPGRRGAATAQEPAALHPAKLHLEVPAAEEGWVDSGWTRARGCRGTQIGPRRVLLGTLPQPVFRQPDVTRLHGTDPPDHCFEGGAGQIGGSATTRPSGTPARLGHAAGARSLPVTRTRESATRTSRTAVQLRPLKAMMLAWAGAEFGSPCGP